MLPVVVVCGGALILLPLSPLLIFGFAPLPALGVAGAALAILLYYAVGSLIFASYLWGRYGVLRPAFLPPRLEWEPIREILRVGALSAIVKLDHQLDDCHRDRIRGLGGRGGACRLRSRRAPGVHSRAAVLWNLRTGRNHDRD
jgi:hypothetical protein